MKYLGILVVAALVLLGSVAMALGAYDLERWGGFSTYGRYNGTGVSVGVTLEVWVYPYLYLDINYTGFRWHLYEAAPGEVYQDTVATATIKTNWPQVRLTFTGFDDPKKGNSKIDASWGLRIQNVGEWWKAADQVNGTYDRYVPFIGQEFTVEILNKIELPTGVVPGQYSNTGTITATLPSTYWP